MIDDKDKNGKNAQNYINDMPTRSNAWVRKPFLQSFVKSVSPAAPTKPYIRAFSEPG